MGSCELILSDKDNELNVFDFGENPAALVEDQRETWMAAQIWADYVKGNFRRQLDPKNQNQLNIQAEAVKPLGPDRTFRGFIRYYTEELQNIDRALEYEPYHDIFTAIDTTRGTFDYYGPILGLEYSRQVSSRIALGVKVVYRLQDGLKREPSKTKVDGRIMHGVVGAYFRPHRHLALGLAFRPFSVQYRLNADKSFLLDYPIIYKFFGDSLLVKNERVSSYNRRTRGAGFCTDGVIIYRFCSEFRLACKAGYELESKQIDEGSSAGHRDIDDYGSWQKQGTWAKAICRMHPHFWPLTFGISLDWRSWNAWARTPRFQTLFEEMNGGWTKYGFGFAFEKTDYPFTLGVEYYATKFNEEKYNYYQNYEWRRQNRVEFLKVGGEIRVTPGFAARFGGGIGKEVAEYHLSFDPVRVVRLSISVGVKLNQFNFDLTAYYEKLRPNHDNAIRERFLLMLQVLQWK